MSETETNPDTPYATRRAAISALSAWTSAFLTIAAIAALVVSFNQLQAKAAQLNATQPRVKFDWPPLAGFSTSEPVQGSASTDPMTWVNAEIRGDLERSVLSKLSTNPFDHAGLTSARESLAATGWFRDDLRLLRDADGLVRVSGSWRIPAAAVRSGNQDMLVSSTGELLPVKYRADASGYKVIVGVAAQPPALGKPWLGGDVQAGLQLINALSSLPCPDQIAAIDVSEYGPSRSLTIVTDLGNRILWGGPIDDFNPGQASPAAKLGRLAQVCREFGRIDAGRQVLDIRLLDGVYVHDTTGVLARAEQNPPETKNSAKGDKSVPSKTKKSVSR